MRSTAAARTTPRINASARRDPGHPAGAGHPRRLGRLRRPVAHLRRRRPHLRETTRLMRTTLFAKCILVLLSAIAVTACSGQKEGPAPGTPATPARLRRRAAVRGHAVRGHAGDSRRQGRADSADGLAVRRPAGIRPRVGRQAIHRRLRRDGQAPRDSRRRDLQPHALLRRPGAGAWHYLRVVEAVRDRPERAAQDGQPQAARGDGADAARSALQRPSPAAGSTWSRRWSRSRRSGRSSPPSRNPRAPASTRSWSPARTPRRSPRSTTWPGRRSLVRKASIYHESLRH